MRRCLHILESLYAPIAEQIQAEAFTKPGGYELYRNEMTALESNYLNTPGKGIMVSAQTPFESNLHSNKRK